MKEIHYMNSLYLPFSALGADHLLSLAGYESFVYSEQHRLNQVTVFYSFLLSVIE